MKLLGRGSSRVKIRPLASFQDLRSETGRAAEGGGTIHIAIGNGGLIGEDTVTSLAALEVVEELADTAVLYNAPPIITVGDPTLLPLAQDILRRAYERHDLVKRYDPDQVRFVAPSPVAYAAGAANIVMSEDVMSNAMIGAFGPEVSLITDAGARRDLPQLAAAAASDALGALYPVTDRLAVGEELYAAGAQMTETKRYTISLQAQDILRLVLAGFIIMTAALALLAKLLS
jgi:hypothetical protein